MITVSQLSKSSLRAKELTNIIKEHLFIIDDKILKSNKTWGRNVIVHELPTTFVNISGADRSDIQRLLYSAILKNLEKRGFETKILLDVSKTVLYIAWVTEYSREDIDNMNIIIQKNRISPKDVDTFMQL